MIIDKILMGAVIGLGLALAGLWTYDRTILARQVYAAGEAAEKAREAVRIAEVNAQTQAAEDVAAAVREARQLRDAEILAELKLLPVTVCGDTPAPLRAKLDCIGGQPCGR